MPTRSLSVLGVFLIVASSSFAMAANQSKVVGVLDGYFLAWETRDINKIGNFFAENISVFDLPSGSTITGREKVMKHMEWAWLSAAPDMVWVRASEPFVSGNTVAYEWLYEGTYSGKWDDATIINKPFSIKGFSSTTINESGKIISQRDFYDLKSFEKQLEK